MLGLGSSLGSLPVLSGYTNSHHAEFDGSSQYIETNANLQSILRESFTIAFWVRLDDGVANPGQNFIGVRASSSEQFNIGIGKNNGALLFFLKGANDPHLETTDTAVFADGVNDWKHIAVTMDKSGDPATSIIYVDGDVFSSTTGSTITNLNQGALNISSARAFIGAISNAGTAAEFMDGGMDEVAVWSTALHPSIIAKVAVAGADLLDVAATSLEHWWQLNNDVTEAAGGVDGTNQGATFGTSVAS